MGPKHQEGSQGAIDAGKLKKIRKRASKGLVSHQRQYLECLDNKVTTVDCLSCMVLVLVEFQHTVAVVAAQLPPTCPPSYRHRVMQLTPTPPLAMPSIYLCRPSVSFIPCPGPGINSLGVLGQVVSVSTG